MKQNSNNIENFLNAETPKKPGFSLPENYFIELEEEILCSISENKLPNNKSFTVPNNYFDNLEDSLLKKIKTANTKPKAILIKKKVLKLISFGVAASFMLFLSVEYFLKTNTNQLNFDSVSELAIENWIVDNVTELSDDDFASILENEILTVNDFSFNQIKNEAIEDYLIQTENTSILNEND
ncbi:hypothetical protein [Polaribacter tangerinus]|uniref:hypothetical protein n=1 Tax=Polaribacter tangerinus TaxID=1920034 RepID=UPI000B4AABA3|nr:hypothetical protein [Polaribacter tangerinus]